MNLRDMARLGRTANRVIVSRGAGQFEDLAVAEGYLVGRATGGALAALTAAQARTLLGVAVSTAPASPSMVAISDADGDAAWIDVAENRIVGRIAGASAPDDLMPGQVRTILGITAGPNELVAGGVSSPTALAVGASTVVGRTAAGQLAALTKAEARMLTKTPRVRIVEGGTVPATPAVHVFDVNEDEMVLMGNATQAGLNITLPEASTVGLGFRMFYGDSAGDASTHNIDLATAGTDGFNGATTISTNYQVKTAVVIDATPSAGVWLVF